MLLVLGGFGAGTAGGFLAVLLSAPAVDGFLFSCLELLVLLCV
ncbi:hypothetical protein MGSAQ_001224 [marine sediment metagenome]|uniref:Uncharacterized protein n=1 Tax=marine sediment metagenome TaxID=412755 RepID=A0A1B6NV08_9ZZZZ